MTRRHWIACTLGGAVISCRRDEQVTAVEIPAPEWIDLANAWQHAMGGALDEPEPGTMRLAWGESLSAMKWTGPAVGGESYEVELEARRVDGTDFFCGLTFPAGPDGECLTWVVGGWGGGLVGLSSINGQDASQNETRSYRKFETARWYRLRLRRSAGRIEAWIDGERVIDLETAGRVLSLRPGPIDVCAPFGLATWQSTGEFRRIRWRPLAP